jgi:D-alanine-D-alanine ligase-like ATP-grasp enzyme
VPSTRCLFPRQTAGALPSALATAFDYDDRVLIEDVVEGREIDIAVLGRPDGTRIVAPALEIVADGIFDSRPSTAVAPTSGCLRD